MAEYSIGIDLGTTNSALAFTRIGDSPEVRLAQIPQLTAANEVSAGVMGLGVIGSNVADVLGRLGFQVAGWSRTPKSLPGVETFHGSNGLDAFLARTEILVCLLPLTPETRGTLNMAIPAVVSNALLRKISADLSFHRARSPVEARRRIAKRLLDAPFYLELFTPALTAQLRDLAQLTPGTELLFPESISEPAVMMVDDTRVCVATAVRVNSHRAARVLSMDAPKTPPGEL